MVGVRQVVHLTFVLKVALTVIDQIDLSDFFNALKNFTGCIRCDFVGHRLNPCVRGGSSAPHVIIYTVGGFARQPKNVQWAELFSHARNRQGITFPLCLRSVLILGQGDGVEKAGDFYGLKIRAALGI